VTVRLRDLGHRYRGAEDWALRGVNLDVAPGEVLAVVGPSGSGKSTLLRLLVGLATPSAGSIEIAGSDHTRSAPERRPVSLVFQGYALYPHLTVAENIGFGLRVRRAPRAERARRVQEVAERLDLTRLLDRLPGQLSGGERQRTALARALVRDPVVFCLDEPLSSLDPLLRTAARRELDALLRADGRCAVYVTHDQDEAMTVGDRVAVLRNGVLEQVATPRELYDRPVTPRTTPRTGSPPMALVRAGAAGAWAAGLDAAPDDLLGVRAEHVTIGVGDDATVVLVDDHGHELVLTLDLGAGTTLVARESPGMGWRVGQRVGVRVDRSRVRVFRG
jgi:ABC-type sugar transport system ATPase subunit